MKCFLGHIGRWNHDITGGTPIKILSLKINLCTTHWLDMEGSERAVYLSFPHENTKMQENEESAALSILIFGAFLCTVKLIKQQTDVLYFSLNVRLKSFSSTFLFLWKRCFGQAHSYATQRPIRCFQKPN